MNIVTFKYIDTYIEFLILSLFLNHDIKAKIFYMHYTSRAIVKW